MTPMQIYAALDSARTSGPFSLAGISFPLIFMPIATAIAITPKPVTATLVGVAGITGVVTGAATVPLNPTLALSALFEQGISGATALSLATVLATALAALPWTFTGPIAGLATGTGSGVVSVVPQTLIGALAASLPPSALSGTLSVAIGNAVCRLLNSAIVTATALGAPMWPPAPMTSIGSYVLT